MNRDLSRGLNCRSKAVIQQNNSNDLEREKDGNNKEKTSFRMARFNRTLYNGWPR